MSVPAGRDTSLWGPTGDSADLALSDSTLATYDRPAPSSGTPLGMGDSVQAVPSQRSAKGRLAYRVDSEDSSPTIHASSGPAAYNTRGCARCSERARRPFDTTGPSTARSRGWRWARSHDPHPVGRGPARRRRRPARYRVLGALWARPRAGAKLSCQATFVKASGMGAVSIRWTRLWSAHILAG